MSPLISRRQSRSNGPPARGRPLGLKSRSHFAIAANRLLWKVALRIEEGPAATRAPTDTMKDILGSVKARQASP